MENFQNEEINESSESIKKQEEFFNTIENNLHDNNENNHETLRESRKIVINSKVREILHSEPHHISQSIDLIQFPFERQIMENIHPNLQNINNQSYDSINTQIQANINERMKRKKEIEKLLEKLLISKSKLQSIFRIISLIFSLLSSAFIILVFISFVFMAFFHFIQLNIVIWLICQLIANIIIIIFSIKAPSNQEDVNSRYIRWFTIICGVIGFLFLLIIIFNSFYENISIIHLCSSDIIEKSTSNDSEQSSSEDKNSQIICIIQITIFYASIVEALMYFGFMIIGIFYYKDLINKKLLDDEMKTFDSTLERR